MLILGGREPFELLALPYGRAAYLRHGGALMALKYVVDAAVIWAVAGVFWTPADYVLSLASLQGSKPSTFPPLLNLWLLLWTLPFVCLGVVLSVRRARDAGIPPWIVVGFFLPVVNYAVIAALAVWPTAPPRPEPPTLVESDRAPGRSGRAIAAGVAAGIGTGVLCVAAGILLFRTYGAAMFVVTPFLVGMLSAMVADWVDPAGPDRTVAVVFMTLGGIVVLLAVPAGHALDAAAAAPPSRVVHSEIVVDAALAAVWTHVLGFSDISARPEWYFRLGLSYPVRARIQGTGVGAVRHIKVETETASPATPRTLPAARP